MTKKKTWYERLKDKVSDTDDAVGASKHARGKRRPKGHRRAKKLARKRAKTARKGKK